MPDVLQRAKLARTAARLNAQAGLALPSLVLMTDDLRLADPLAAARALPWGAAVIVRARDATKRAALAAAMMTVARQRHLIVLVAGDGELAARLDADGLHLPEAGIGAALRWRALRPRWLITAAAHSARALLRAKAARADAALLSPVFATASHPDGGAFGPSRFRLLAGLSPLPVYALGGIDDRSAGRLAGARLAGLAAIGALAP